MGQLLDLAQQDEASSLEAYIGLLRRFTITSSKGIEDEEEKGWVYRRLSSVGKPILPAIRQFCLQHENVAWALRILEDIANEDEEWSLLDELLAELPPDVFQRTSAKKIQILTHIQEIDNPKIVDIFVAYLNDVDESVRYFSVEALIDIADEKSLAPMIERLLHDQEDSLRLRTRILEGLATLKWDISEFKSRLSPRLGDDHVITGNVITRR